MSTLAVSASSGASVRLVVDSHPVEIQAGATVLEAVNSLGRHMEAVFVPFVKLANSAATLLTNAAFDPHSKVPEYKVCAVKLELLTGAC
jgi:assimilatory nitrate reductase catalytic subunit